jgi:hypothetical protein
MTDLRSAAPGEWSAGWAPGGAPGDPEAQPDAPTWTSRPEAQPEAPTWASRPEAQAAEAGPAAGAPEPSWDQPGGLEIKEKRSWRTWHVLVAAFASLLVGMAIGHAGSSGSSAGGSAQPLFKLPDSGGTPTTATLSAGDAPTTTTSVVAPASTPVAPTPVTGVAKVLVTKTGTGPLPPTAFAVKGGTWNIGWAYDCTKSGSADGAGTFHITVAPPSGSAAIAVDETGRSNKGVTPRTEAGALSVEVRTACRWVLKVTGIPA